MENPLRLWLKANGVEPINFARRIAVTRRTLYRYLYDLDDPRFRVPGPAEITKIYLATGGAVDANAFHILPDLAAPRTANA